MTSILTVKEVASLLKTSRQQVRKMIQIGDLPAVKIGREWRIRADVLDEFLTEERGIHKQTGGELITVLLRFVLVPASFLMQPATAFSPLQLQELRYSFLAIPQNSKNLYAGVSRASAIRSSVVKEIGLYMPAASIWPI